MLFLKSHFFSVSLKTIYVYKIMRYLYLVFFLTIGAVWKSSFKFFIIACRVPFFSSSLNNKNKHLFLYRYPSAMPGESGENWQDRGQWFTRDNQRGPQTGFTIISSLNLSPRFLKKFIFILIFFFNLRNYINVSLLYSSWWYLKLDECIMHSMRQFFKLFCL